MRRTLLSLLISALFLVARGAPTAAQAPPPGGAPAPMMTPPSTTGTTPTQGEATEHSPALAYAFAVVSSILVLLIVCYPTRKQ